MPARAKLPCTLPVGQGKEGEGEREGRRGRETKKTAAVGREGGVCEARALRSGTTHGRIQQALCA